MKALMTVVAVLWFNCRLVAQSPDVPAGENWNLYYQATSIGQTHGTFHAPYTGPLSLQDYPRARRLPHDDAVLRCAPRQESAILFSIPRSPAARDSAAWTASPNPPNGELPRVASATPKPYIARLYLTYDFGFGSEKEHVESDENQAGRRPPDDALHHYAGRFSLTDFFDNNAYTHDPRTQFMAWGVMYNGAWDYPADTRGYTWGWVHEFHTRNWSLRYGSAAEPKVANGGHFDRRLFLRSRRCFRRRAALLAGQPCGRPSALLRISQSHAFGQLCGRHQAG